MSSKTMREILREARAMGFVVTRTGAGHTRLERQDPHAVVYASSTPSDRHAVRNIRRNLVAASDPLNPFGKVQQR